MEIERIDRFKAGLKKYGFDNQEPHNTDQLATYMAHYSAGQATKGLILLGKPGRGKTRALRIMAEIFNLPYFEAKELAKMDIPEIYRIGKLQQLCFQPGLSIIDPDDGKPQKLRYRDIVIDDIGVEPSQVNVFGTRIGVMMNLLDDRDQVFRDYHAKTFTSTQLDMDDLVDIYGGRIKSRIRGMCNTVVFKGPDRRNTGNEDFMGE